MASCRSILLAKNNTGIFLQRMSKVKQTDGHESRRQTGSGQRLRLSFLCTLVAEESVQFLFGNNHPQLVAAVNDEYDGVAFSEEDKGGRG